MKVSTENFRGEVPRVTPRALPDNAAQDATNARLVTGDVTPWKQFVPVKTIDRDAPVQTIALLDDNWLSFNEQVDVARGIIPGDTTFRTYLTGLDVPRFTTLAMATGGPEPYPADTRILGVPAPQTAPTVVAGIDTSPTSFTIDTLDEGGSLATDWTVNSPIDVNWTFAIVDQEAVIGDPAPSYRVRYDENRGPGQDAWAMRDFGVAGVSVLEVTCDFYMLNYAQAVLNVACTPESYGISLIYQDGSLIISKRTGFGALYNQAVLVSEAVPAPPAALLWHSMKVSVILNETGTKTVTGSLYDDSGTLLKSVTATGTFDDGNNCGFANGTPADIQQGATKWTTYYDNYHVKATGSTNYVPVNTATSYVYTFVNDLGEESAPSLASATVLRPAGVSITVTTPTDTPSGTDPDYGITTKRIYRAATGSSGTVFLFVAEIPLAQAEFEDNLDDTALGEPLETEDWDLPPSDLRGILALPNGVMAGFRRNQLCLSAQNRPHAWPVRNRVNTDTDIVGIGNIDTTVVIGTKSFPYVASGNDPSAYGMAKFEVPQACVSKRSVAYLSNIGVVFASPDGLIAVSGVGQIRNLTETIFTREQWQALNPASIVGIAHDDVYHFFYDTEATP